MINKDSMLRKLDSISLSDKASQRSGILNLEQALLSMPQADMPFEHLLHGGVYARALHIPAGCALTGAIYKYDHIEIMVKGELVVTTDDGHCKTLKGFNMIPAMSGKKRAAMAIEDTTWITFHAVGSTNLTPDEVQNSITVKSFDELDYFYNQVNNADYQIFLNESGLSQEQMDEIVNHDDVVELNLKEFGLSIKDSKIHGVGVFTDVKIIAGEFLAPARMKSNRTQLGRYINHAIRPNCKFVFDGVDLNCVAIDDISAGDELTVNYRDTIESRMAEGDL